MGFGCLAAAGLVWGGLGVSVLLDGLFRVGWGSVAVVLVGLPVFWAVLGGFGCLLLCDLVVAFSGGCCCSSCVFDGFVDFVLAGFG